MILSFMYGGLIWWIYVLALSPPLPPSHARAILEPLSCDLFSLATGPKCWRLTGQPSRTPKVSPGVTEAVDPSDPALPC